MSKSILLADDSPTIHKVVEITFSDTDYLIETASSGAEALAKLDEVRPDFVLADVVMPEPAGYELCRRIKSSARPVPVLLLAGTFEAFDHDAARSCGADGCLLKPFEPRTLLERVASLLAARDAVGLTGVEPIATEIVAPATTPSAGGEEPSDTGQERGTVPEPQTEPVYEHEPLAELAPDTIDAIAREVVRRISEDVVRQIAREVVPPIAEAVIRERVRKLEQEDP